MAYFRNIALVLLFCLLLLTHSVADTVKLSGYGVDISKTSVSGLSSGAFATSQLHVAYSSVIMGVGIVAGGPYLCAGVASFTETFYNARTMCMNPVGSTPDSSAIFAKAQYIAKQGQIDDLGNLKDDKVYIFSGSNDSVVKTKVVDETDKFYRLAGVPAKNIYYNKTNNAGHALITNNDSDQSCSLSQSPYINNCGFMQSHEILKHIYGPLKPPSQTLSGKLVKFDQTEFITSKRASMSKEAYAYIPASCEKTQCNVHVVLHGCSQGASKFGDKFYKSVGYNELADSNGIIVLYPQAEASIASAMNPLGCWDFWGYSSLDQDNLDYYAKTAPQMAAIIKMLYRLAEHGID